MCALCLWAKIYIRLRLFLVNSRSYPEGIWYTDKKKMMCICMGHFSSYKYHGEINSSCLIRIECRLKLTNKEYTSLFRGDHWHILVSGLFFLSLNFMLKRHSSHFSPHMYYDVEGNSSYITISIILAINTTGRSH